MRAGLAYVSSGGGGTPAVPLYTRLLVLLRPMLCVRAAERDHLVDGRVARRRVRIFKPARIGHRQLLLALAAAGLDDVGIGEGGEAEALLLCDGEAVSSR